MGVVGIARGVVLGLVVGLDLCLLGLVERVDPFRVFRGW